MDFNWAINEIRNGNRVRRHVWDKELYYFVYNGELKFNIWDGTIETPTIASEELRAEDWELFEEQKTLSDKIYTIKSAHFDNTEACTVESIKEFIKQVKNEHRKQCVDEDYSNGVNAVFKSMNKYAGDRFR